jgi:putative sigma-54 modulation protein
MVLDKLEKQIKKGKQKIREHRTASKFSLKEISDTELMPAEDDTEPEVMVRNIEYKPMDIDEALMQMDLVKDNFLVFTNAHTDRVNVLYRRKDGHYGLIQPRK